MVSHLDIILLPGMLKFITSKNDAVCVNAVKTFRGLVFGRDVTSGQVERCTKNLRLWNLDEMILVRDDATRPNTSDEFNLLLTEKPESPYLDILAKPREIPVRT